MNFLYTLIRFAVIGMLLFFVGFFGGRELLLYIASAQVVTDARIVAQPPRWKDQSPQCAQSSIEGQNFDGFQLRFLDDHSYALEVRCIGIAPAVKETKTLPFGVKKTTGTAGFFFDHVTQNFTGEITLVLWGQKKTIFVDENDAVAQVWGETQARSAVPVSACLAHGLRCCDPVQQAGVGEVVGEGVSDCPGQCYQSCQQRPLLLSFQTDPPGEYEQRRLRLPELSALVIFSYVVDDRESPVGKVTISYGDGTTAELTQSTGQFTKEFQCQTAPCRFAVTLEVEDQRGISLAQSRLLPFFIELGVPGSAVLH